MSLVEQARTRLEEARTRVKTRVEKIRGGSSILSGNPGHELPTIEEVRAKLPTIEEVKAKGVLSVLEEKFPKVKEIRQKGVLARFLGKSGGQVEPRKEAAISGEEEVTPRPRRRGAIAA